MFEVISTRDLSTNWRPVSRTCPPNQQSMWRNVQKPDWIRWHDRRGGLGCGAPSNVGGGGCGSRSRPDTDTGACSHHRTGIGYDARRASSGNRRRAQSHRGNELDDGCIDEGISNQSQGQRLSGEMVGRSWRLGRLKALPAYGYRGTGVDCLCLFLREAGLDGDALAGIGDPSWGGVSVS